ncbi:MAG: CcmD family protein [Coriobacteriales bacterium]|nr:CcmD family protein [Actinomycetes bacterium]
MGDIYSQVLPQAPYVIAAYALIWVSLLGFVGVVFSRLRRLEKELDVLEESLKRREQA